MIGSNKAREPESLSGPDVFAEISILSKKLITDMLQRMINGADDYHGWSLSDVDGARVSKLIQHQQRIICSSFKFQLNRHFSAFKAAVDSPATNQGSQDWQALGISSTNATVEINELQEIKTRYDDAFNEFDRTLLKRMQACIKRSRASIHENPLQVKRLCEAFQYAIDSLNLELSYKIALYHLFADRFIEALGPFYRRIDQVMYDHGMLRDIPLARIHLRSIDGLSESDAPVSMKPDQTLNLLMLLQEYREKARRPAIRYQNLFPELRHRFAESGIDRYQEQIDQLEPIFELVFEDEDLPSSVKLQLTRLQIHLFASAIQEDGLLRGSSNPARRLLNGIVSSEVEIARGGNPEFSGIDYIRDHIDALASRECVSLDSYTEMLEGYRIFIQENEIAIRRARKTEATQKILPLVKTRLNEIIQPLKIQGTPLILFEKVWLPLLVQIGLQQGMDSDSWHKTAEIVKKQVWSMIPKANREEQEELRRALPQIAHSLHRAMRSLKLAEPLQQSLRDYLKLEQQNVLEETGRNIIAAKRRTRSLGEQSFSSMEDTTEFDAMLQTGVFQVPTEMLEAMDSGSTREPKSINQAQALATGAWVHMLQNGQKTLAKLAWKAEDSSLYIFVDRDGTRICEVDGDKLSEQFESGEVSLMNSAVDSEKTQFSFMKTL